MESRSHRPEISRRWTNLTVVALGAIFLFGTNPLAFGDQSDVSLLFVRKSKLYSQVDGSAPTLQTNPFTFQAGASPTGANRITSAQFTPPGGTPKIMTNIGGGTFFFDGGRFASQAALNTAFLNGTYTFNLQTVTIPQAYSDSVTIGSLGDLYPNIPTQQNGTWSSGALQVDATKLYTFNWNDVSPTSGTQMVFTIRDASGVSVFSQTLPPDPSGFAINLNMPANTLQPGAYYTANLAFERRTITTVSPTFTKISTYSTEESFKIATINAIPAVTGPSTPLATVGQLFVYQIIASNHPFSYGANNLPANNLNLDSNLGIISGVPNAAGTIPTTLSATNIDGVGTKSNFSITIQAPQTGAPIIVSSTCAHFYMGQPFTFQVVTKGATQAARLTATGLPAGLTLDPITGEISGTTNAIGSFPVSLTLTDGKFTVPGFIQLSFTNDPGYPIITNADTVLLPKNVPFTYKIATPGATDPADPVKYTMFAPTGLPAGLGFDAATGTISGSYTGPIAPSSADSPDAPSLSGGALLGAIQLFGTNSHGTSTFQLLFLAAPTGAVNISTRLLVGIGENVLIGGFIVTGNAPKVVIIRALGPSTGVPGALQDPVLELHNISTGGVVKNDNWRTDQEQIIKDTTIPPKDDREAAIVISLDPGNYTAIVSGNSGGTGIGLVEVYDLGTASLDSGSKAQLAQISTRGKVQQGDNVMIGGFIVSGIATKVVLRAIGPSLTNFGIANALLDPTLELHDGNGTTIRSNDDWKIREDGSSQQTEVQSTGVPPNDDRESAIVQTLTPSAYTVIVRGKGTATGIALVEVYSLP